MLRHSGHRMDRIGSTEVWDGAAKTTDDLMAELSKVTIAEVNKLAAEFLVKPLTLGLAGPQKSTAEFERILS